MKKWSPGFDLPVSLYFIFVFVVTPGLFLIAFVVKARSAARLPGVVGPVHLPPWSEWPWWQLTAAVIGFAAWALAVPNGPTLLSDPADNGILAGLLALFTSTILAQIDRIFLPHT